jgi:ketosteroid isomerase-like protein
MRPFVTALLLGSALLASCATTPTPASQAITAHPQAVVDELLNADRAFSAASAQTDTVTGLSAMLDQNVVMFVIPVRIFAHGKAQGIEVLNQAFAATPSKTQWTPIRGGVSADGQQGFTYGYATTKAEGQPDKLGKYVSYWIKRPEGWRVIAFKWIPRAEGNVTLTLRDPSLPGRIVPVNTDATTIAQYKTSLDQRERSFSDKAQKTGLGTAFREYGSADSMNFAGDVEFTFGNEAIAAIQGGDAPGSPFTWAPDDVLVASSGDLGLTWGLLTRTGPTPPGRSPTIPFFTIWHRNSPSEPWFYIAE